MERKQNLPQKPVPQQKVTAAVGSTNGGTVKKGKDDFECPICLEIIAEPVMTPCNCINYYNFIFCSNSQKQVIKISCKHLFCLSCQKQVLQLNATCPMCRRQFDEQFVPKIDLDTQKQIEQMFPQDFEERKEQLIKAGLWRGSKFPIRFTFGNLHSDIKNPKVSNSDKQQRNSHRWIMFVALANDPNKDKVGKFIKSVTYHLHPTFKPSVVKVSQAPFLISRIGWGYFEIHLEIEFKKWTGIPKMELDHMLCFEDNGKQEGFIIELEREEPPEEDEVSQLTNNFAKKLNIKPQKNGRESD